MSLYRRVALLLVGLVVLTSLLHLAGVFTATENVYGPLEAKRQRLETQRVADELTLATQALRADILVALEASPVDAVAAADGDDGKKPDVAAVVQALTALLTAHPDYLQARVLGPAPQGHEIVRVERSKAGGPIRVVAPQDLQNKGKRPYYLAAIALPKHNVFISPIELNREHGEVQTPHVPVIRAAAPIFFDDQISGAVVLNVDLRPTLESLRPADGSQRRHYLLDERGQLLLAPGDKDTFTLDLGRDLPEVKELEKLGGLLATNEPAVVHSDAFDNSEWVTVVPIQVGGGPRLRLVSFSSSLGAQTLKKTGQLAILLTLAIAATAVFIALIGARSVTRPLETMTRIADRFPEATEPLPKDAPGEVGILAGALDRMNSSLRQRTQQLTQTEQELRQVIEASPIGLIIVKPDQTIALVNPGAAKLLRYDRDELVGKPLDSLVPGDKRDHHHALAQSFFENPTDRPMGALLSIRARRKDGSEVPVEVGLAPVETGQGPAVLASMVDISAHEQAVTRMLQSNRELEQYAYIASHDLQEPLRTVTNYAQLISRRYQGKLDESADRFLRYITEGSQRMQALVRDLLTVSRVQSQGETLAPTSLEEALDEIRRSLDELLKEHRVQFVVHELPWVMADAGQLRLLLQNLIHNAVKFRSDERPHIEIGAAEDDAAGFWQIYVRDNGIGMSPDQTSRIFEMFQRLHGRNEYQGSGIGLALARRIVERHGGRIWVASEKGKGTTFRFTLRKAPVEVDA